mmetsp:Transcript_75311/g.161355  ORF Transcript_75311/g.161355 Transcript_75311/m.161355 type:complete len:282 (+) Transcript_75311:566-1411(+)
MQQQQLLLFFRLEPHAQVPLNETCMLDRRKLSSFAWVNFRRRVRMDYFLDDGEVSKFLRLALWLRRNSWGFWVRADAQISRQQRQRCLRHSSAQCLEEKLYPLCHLSTPSCDLAHITHVMAGKWCKEETNHACAVAELVNGEVIVQSTRKTEKRLEALEDERFCERQVSSYVKHAQAFAFVPACNHCRYPFQGNAIPTGIIMEYRFCEEPSKTVTPCVCNILKQIARRNSILSEAFSNCCADNCFKSALFKEQGLNAMGVKDRAENLHQPHDCTIAHGIIN